MTSPIPTNESQLLKEALLSIETASRPASAFVDPDIEVISRYNAELIITQALATLSAKPDRQEGTGEAEDAMETEMFSIVDKCIDGYVPTSQEHRNWLAATINLGLRGVLERHCTKPGQGGEV